jgi:hypothetical protein
MQTNSTADPAKSAGVAPLPPPEKGKSPIGFIDFVELALRIPLCERSLREAIRRGQIPSIRLPHSRRVMFDWDSVREALLRMQGGIE